MVISPMEQRIRNCWARWIRPHISEPLHRQRLKLIWCVWGYWPLLTLRAVSPLQRCRLLGRFLLIDWNVLHGHRPYEVSMVCRALAERPARPGEVLVEAGCWQGGSSAKFSHVCALLGYRLRIYDSFQGVAPMTEAEKRDSFDFSGAYAPSEDLVLSHLERFGRLEVCSTHPGWFADTLAREPLRQPVRIAYIDCDVAKGTGEALAGIVPALVSDGWIFSQDYHINPVMRLLTDPATWAPFGKEPPAVERFDDHLAGMRF